jgi:hypothetical protein
MTGVAACNSKLGHVGHVSCGNILQEVLLPKKEQGPGFPGELLRLRACALAFLLVLVLSGCTAIGLHNAVARAQHDFGVPDTVRLCLYLDDGVSEGWGRALIAAAWREEGQLYGLNVTVASVTRWRRPGFTVEGILTAIQREPLVDGCDRVFALVGRHAGDALWGLFLPEVLGAVNDETLTHGYAVVHRASINQILTSPTDVVRHELYHLLGCDTHFRMHRCYEQIARLKRWKQDNRSDFFPAWDLIRQQMLVSREAVNDRLKAASQPTSITAR